MNMPPLVVLRSSDICFLGILRSCGIVNIPVVPVVFDWPGSGPWFSEFSKFFINPVNIPNPAQDESGAVKALINLGKRLTDQYGRKIMIVPSSDTNLMLLQNNFFVLKPYYLQMGAPDFSMPRMDVIRKDSFAAMLESKGIATPKTIPCLKKTDIERCVEEIKFPCVYKPTHKDYLQSFQNSHQMYKAIECLEPDELRQRLSDDLDKGYELIVQEKVEFMKPWHESSCHVYADSEYEIRMASTSNKEGEIPKKYGSGTLSRLTWIEELLSLAQSIVSALKWNGMMGIEFIKDRRDGKWKVIEANCRPWLHIYMQSHCGFNHFKMLYQETYNNLPPSTAPITPSEDLVASRPLHINLSAAMEKINQELRKRKPNPDPLTDWVENISGTLSFNYLNAEDPAPGLHELEYLSNKYGEPLKTILSLLNMLCKATIRK